MALAARRFFLGDTEEGLYPLDMAELQNTSQPWNDPSDKDRLKFVYQPNVQYDIQGRSYVPQMGAPNVERTNVNLYAPRVDPTFPGDMSSSGNCPYGFYWYNGTCIPGTTLDPTSPNFLGGRVGQGPAKGVLMTVQPPKVTYTNQPFQLAAQVQNVGGKPAKFAIKTSIEQLNIEGSLSGSAYLNPGQSGWIYQTISFSNIPSGTLQQAVIQAKLDLVRMEQQTTGGEITYILDDQNIVTIPSPRLSTLPVGPPQGLPLDNYSRFPPGGPLPYPVPGGRPPMYPPPQRPPYYPSGPFYHRGQLYIHPQKSQYNVGESITIYAIGFTPKERVTFTIQGGGRGGGIQVGNISIGGRQGGETKDSDKSDGYGRAYEQMRIPKTYDGAVTITARGKSSGVTAETEIPVRSSSSGGISIGGGMFGGLFG